MDRKRQTYNERGTAEEAVVPFLGHVLLFVFVNLYVQEKRMRERERERK
jgi:hypothetical protein